jgi:hypothetical protein
MRLNRAVLVLSKEGSGLYHPWHYPSGGLVYRGKLWCATREITEIAWAWWVGRVRTWIRSRSRTRSPSQTLHHHRIPIRTTALTSNSLSTACFFMVCTTSAAAFDHSRIRRFAGSIAASRSIATSACNCGDRHHHQRHHHTIMSNRSIMVLVLVVSKSSSSASTLPPSGSINSPRFPLWASYLDLHLLGKLVQD